MSAAEQIFETIDNLQTGRSDIFRSHKNITEEPDAAYIGWHLRQVTSLNFSNLTKITHITRLYLQDCKRLQSLKWLERFPNLEHLWIYGSDKLDSIDGIQASKKLKSLTIWPSFSSNITLDSLAPIATLNQLEALNFSGKTRDGLLHYLNSLPHLKSVFFSNSYSWEEVARFEANHPHVEFPWKGGVVFEANPEVLQCKKCSSSQAMLSGKRLKLTCPKCDASYLAKHLERYRKISLA